MKSGIKREEGMLMIEVLITILIVSIGLLGIAAMFMRSQVVSDEAYQRYQALDMAHQLSEQLSTNRTEANLGAASAYVTGTTGGALPGAPSFTPATACSPCTPSEMAAKDLTLFNDLIIGAQKTQGSSKISALIAARGCVEFLGDSATVEDPPRYRISVVWQGRQASTDIPSGGSDCGGLTLYGTDKLRRIVSLEVQVL